MIELKGEYGEAIVYSNEYENKAISQIIELLNQEWTKDLSIKIMPDYHAGAGCVIGTTMNIKDKIVPNLVGVDIGCGMTTVKLGKINVNLEELDDFIRENIPSGRNVNDYHTNFKEFENLLCKKHLNKDRALKSIGTLGGGNHFIEVDKSESGDLFLIIHSGSRYLGKQIAEYYQNVAVKENKIDENEIKTLIKKLKSQGLQSKIEVEVKKMRDSHPTIQKHLEYLTGENLKAYLNDMNIAQKYAMFNREWMAFKICSYLGMSDREIGENSFETIHNYIDVDNMILRKGAISAREDELLLIPINMRDGCILGRGKGNDEYNQSAPHGAGRLMSRSKAKEMVNLEEFEESMKGIYSTSVVQSTIDESPMAYKPIESILENIDKTVDVIDILKPIYNFKST